MDDLVCVARFDNNMQAELVKNALEAEGISVMLSMDKEAGNPEPIKLVVPSQYEAQALKLLNDNEGVELTDEERATAEEMEADQAQAKEEFEAIHQADLEFKAKGVKRSFITMGLVFSAAALIFFFGPKNAISPRIALGCVLYGVIELFIGLDALKAAKKLQKD